MKWNGGLLILSKSHYFKSQCLSKIHSGNLNLKYWFVNYYKNCVSMHLAEGDKKLRESLINLNTEKTTDAIPTDSIKTAIG